MTETAVETAAPEAPPDGGVAPIRPPSGGPDTATPPDGEPETFGREYVETLRRESAGYRVKAKRSEGLSARLTAAYAAQTGRLADATDLPYDEALLDDEGLVDQSKVTAAVEELLARKPHLASRRPTGDVGQGARPAAETVSLAGLLRSGAG